MEFSYLALFYPSTLGVQLSNKDLEWIKDHKELSAQKIFPLLSEESRDRLRQIKWERLWGRLLDSPRSSVLNFATPLCAAYPKSFLHLQNPPQFISYKGSSIWEKPGWISLVGSRRMSFEVQSWMSHNLPRYLKAAQLGLVSGGARGVDQWAHRIAIQAECPTICVLPSGLGALYPESLIDLADEILSSGGALISAYAYEQSIRKYFFSQRNELIAALGDFCFVAQANLKSGSLLTAQKALDLGKEILTLPYCPWMREGAGANKLLQEGAHMITCERDLIEITFRWL